MSSKTLISYVYHYGKGCKDDTSVLVCKLTSSCIARIKAVAEVVKSSGEAWIDEPFDAGEWSCGDWAGVDAKAADATHLGELLAKLCTLGKEPKSQVLRVSQLAFELRAVMLVDGNDEMVASNYVQLSELDGEDEVIIKFPPF